MVNPVIAEYRRAVRLYAKCAKVSIQQADDLIRPRVIEAFVEQLDRAIQPTPPRHYEPRYK